VEDEDEEEWVGMVVGVVKMMLRRKEAGVRTDETRKHVLLLPGDLRRSP
jgi:hypothetical protein